MEGTPRHRGGPPANPFTPQDVEAGAATTPSAIPTPVKPAPKPAAKPSNPLLPRALAAVAILVLLAIPVAVPLAVMRATGKTGKQLTPLEAAIEGPPVITVVTPPEEITKEEQAESFLKISNSTVSARGKLPQCTSVRLLAQAADEQALPGGCSLSGSAGRTTPQASMHTSWWRLPWCPSALRLSVSRGACPADPASSCAAGSCPVLGTCRQTPGAD
jgi:hypothetical protein